MTIPFPIRRSKHEITKFLVLAVHEHLSGALCKHYVFVWPRVSTAMRTCARLVPARLTHCVLAATTLQASTLITLLDQQNSASESLSYLRRNQYLRVGAEALGSVSDTMACTTKFRRSVYRNVRDRCGIDSGDAELQLQN